MDKEECYNQRTAKHHQPLTWSLRTPGLESGDSRPVSLRGPESRNADNEIQVSFSHAGLGTNLNEQFTEYRERMRSVLQRSHDSDMAGDDQISGMVTLNPPPACQTISCINCLYSTWKLHKSPSESVNWSLILKLWRNTFLQINTMGNDTNVYSVYVH